MFNKINKDKIASMKAKTKVLTTAIKMCISEINTYIIDNSTIENKLTTSDDVVTIVLAKIYKEMNKTLQDYKKYNKTELIEETEVLLGFCEKYLPSKLTEDETIEAIKEVLGTYTEADGNKKGFVMKAMKARGDVDMYLVGRNVGKLL